MAVLVHADQRVGSSRRRLDDAERGAFAQSGRMRWYEREATLVRAGEAVMGGDPVPRQRPGDQRRTRAQGACDGRSSPIIAVLLAVRPVADGR
jgi:hypothetical protein